MVSRCIAGPDVGCHIADPVFPFGSRLRETHAVFPGRDLDDPLAAITLLNNRVAPASVELASHFVHKDALIPLPYSCTNHGNHILSLEILKLTVTSLIPEKRWESIVHLATNQIRKCVLWPKTFSLSIKKIEKILAQYNYVFPCAQPLWIEILFEADSYLLKAEYVFGI